MTAEHKVDVRLTASDNATIAVTRGSKCVTIASATEKLSAIVFIRTAYCAAGLQFYAILTATPDRIGQPSCRSTVSGGSFTVDRVPSQPASVTAIAPPTMPYSHTSALPVKRILKTCSASA